MPVITKLMVQANITCRHLLNLLFSIMGTKNAFSEKLEKNHFVFAEVDDTEGFMLKA